MRLQPLVFGAPVGLIWLAFFVFYPLPSVIMLLMVMAWHDHRRRRVAVTPHPADEEAGARPR